MQKFQDFLENWKTLIFFKDFSRTKKIPLLFQDFQNLWQPWLNLPKKAKSSVIRQKGESQNGGNKKTKYAKFAEKRTFLTPWYVCGVRNFVFREIWRILFSCYLHFEIHPFALLPSNFSFFYLGFSFTNIDESQDWRGGGRAFL